LTTIEPSTPRWRDLAEGLLDGAADDLHPEALLVVELEVVERGRQADERHAAAGDDALFDGRAGRVERVLDAGLLLLHLDLGRGADLDHGHAAGELGEALLELLAVVVAGGVLDLGRGSRFSRALILSSEPAPSMMVVLSLSILTRLARPRSLRVTFSSLVPSSSAIDLSRR
jgi:hypothetical protein